MTQIPLKSTPNDPENGRAAQARPISNDEVPTIHRSGNGRALQSQSSNESAVGSRAVSPPPPPPRRPVPSITTTAPMPALTAIEPQSETRSLPNKAGKSNWWNSLNLRAKVTALSIAVGTIPVLLLGTLAYFEVDQKITKEIIAASQLEAITLEEEINLFVNDRYSDMLVLAQHELFANPEIRADATRQQKDALLNRYVEQYGFYDSVAVFFLNGNVLAQSVGAPLSNHQDRDYFQAVVETSKPFISEPQISKSSGVYSFYIAAPIIDEATGQMIAIVRARIPEAAVEELFAPYAERGKDYYLLSSDDQVTVAKNPELVGKPLSEIFPKLAVEVQQATGELVITARDRYIDNEEILSHASSEELQENYNLDWSVIIGDEVAKVFAAQRQLLLTIILVTGASAAVIGALATALTNRMIRPIEKLQQATQAFAQGNRQVRADAAEDEIGQLAGVFNEMADGVEQQEKFVQQEAERSQSL
ncbi:MAG: HAMP domain-containing protein [Cyanothece sp. SIO1E1]|nr:HAMP domain-containing protein [Cyanothece sp. SIO1E1]